MRSLLAPFIILAILLVAIPGTVAAEYYGIPQQIFRVDISDVRLYFGLSHESSVVTINTDQNFTLNPSLVIMGSNVDAFELEGFENFKANHYVYPEYILPDDARTVAGISSIDEFDLLVVGGPGHNAYAKELQDKGVLTYNATGMKMPALVIESVRMPSGHTVIVIGSVASYPGYVPEKPADNPLPGEAIPLAALTFGTILSIAGVYLAQLYSQVFSFVYGYITTLAGEVACEKEAEIRHLKAHKPVHSLIFGQSWQEIAIAISCVILFAVAYIIADRLDILPENIIIYIIVGGFVVTAHDLGHRIVAYLKKMDAEFQFWGLGALTMLVTSWLFSMVFAQPSRVLIEKDQHPANDIASVMLAGPAVSLVLSLAFLLLMLFGGNAAEIGTIGFSMNMVTVVYSLMPFNPMDGKSIYEWNRRYWAVLFLPITALFIVVTLFELFS